MRYISIVASRVGIRSYLLIKFTVDLTLWTLSAPLVFVLLQLGTGYTESTQEILAYTLLGLPVKGFLAYALALYRQSWHKVGVRDLYALMHAAGLSTVIMLALAFIMIPLAGIPWCVPILDGGVALLMLGAARLFLRRLHEQDMTRGVAESMQRVLVVGAGEAGTMIVREMLRHPEAGLVPVGYLDDESSKHHKLFLGVPVLGAIDALPDVVGMMQVDEVLIAMPSAPGNVVRHVVDLARQHEVDYRIIPGVYDILSGRISISQIREVDVEDLLRRDPIRLNLAEIAAYLEDRVVLVTGAAGSIGAEIARQVIRFNPRQLILLDRDENRLYMLEHELMRTLPQPNFLTLVADIQRLDKLERIFDRYRPQVVFHAAAHKHVPLMEFCPDEAILNNVVGTQNLLDLALKYGVERFVNISTDKAVRPTSIMGVSKRVAESLVVRGACQAETEQVFVSVRFGNVLGSNGSVVPIFREQIRLGGPVTVTHPKMTRYFMSIPEATQLVLQAAGVGENGAICILDMGEPIRIVDLAHDLIQLSGFDPGIEIPIEFMGIRPGEKLHEELLTEDESARAIRHGKILVVPGSTLPGDHFDALLEDLLTACTRDEEHIRSILKELVPSYQPGLRGDSEERGIRDDALLSAK